MSSQGDGSNDEIQSGKSAMSATGERRIRLLENRLDSRELFATTREIMIDHGRDAYRLRLTAQNKLILTK